MLTKTTYKERAASNAAANYIFSQKKISTEKIITIGQSRDWQIKFFDKVLKPKKKNLLTVLADAARLENERETRQILYALEPCEEFVEEPVELKNPKQYAEFFDISEEEAKEICK